MEGGGVRLNSDGHSFLGWVGVFLVFMIQTILLVDWQCATTERTERMGIFHCHTLRKAVYIRSCDSVVSEARTWPSG